MRQRDDRQKKCIQKCRGDLATEITKIRLHNYMGTKNKLYKTED